PLPYRIAQDSFGCLAFECRRFQIVLPHNFIVLLHIEAAVDLEGGLGGDRVGEFVIADTQPEMGCFAVDQSLIDQLLQCHLPQVNRLEHLWRLFAIYILDLAPQVDSCAIDLLRGDCLAPRHCKQVEITEAADLRGRAHTSEVAGGSPAAKEQSEHPTEQKQQDARAPRVTVSSEYL